MPTLPLYVAELPPLIIAYDSKTSRLLDIRDVDEFEDDVVLRTSLLDKSVSRKSECYVSHVDMSCYIHLDTLF